MIRQLFKCLLSIACFALIGCGGGGGGSPIPNDTAPPPISFTHIFPQGDATATQGTAWDIVAVKTTLTGQFGDTVTELYDTLRVDVTFAQDISNALPAPGTFLSSPTGTELGVGIALDTDHNVDTGALQSCDIASNLTPFEFASDPGQEYGRLIDGNYSILNFGGRVFSGGPNLPEEAITSINGHVFSQSFYLPTVGLNTGTSIPKIGVQVGVLNSLSLFTTDCAPKGISEMYTDEQEIQ